MKPRIPLLLLSMGSIRSVGRRLDFIGKPLAKLQPDFGNVLRKVGVTVDPEYYMAGAMVSAFLYGLISFALTSVLLSINPDFEEPLRISLAVGIMFWLVFFMLHIIYPKIVLKKVAAKESRELLFALREILMDVQSGVPLFDSMKNVSSAGYGYVSSDFGQVVKEIEAGLSEREALRTLALKTESEYLKRAVWQMVNALESGTSIGIALPSIVDSLETYLYREIKNYSANLNFLMLIYMMSAAVIPSLGITFLVLLSAFSDFGITLETVGMLVGFSVFMQVILIGYMSSTRPEIFGG